MMKKLIAVQAAAKLEMSIQKCSGFLENFNDFFVGHLFSPCIFSNIK